MAKHSLFLFTLLASSAAQSTKDANTTNSVFLGGYKRPLSASVITANPTMTVYNAVCDWRSPGCYFEVINITVYDKSSNEMTMKMTSPDATSFANCTVHGSATCKGYLAVPEIVMAGETRFPEAEVTFAPLIITAGLEKLKATPNTPSATPGSSPQSSGSAKPSSIEKPNAAIKLTRSWTILAALGVIVLSNF